MLNPFETIEDKLRAITDSISSLGNEVTAIKSKVGSSDEKEILDFESFCAFLGISHPTGYKWTSNNVVPYYKKGAKLYFIKSDLLEWIKSGRVKTQKEISEEAERYMAGRSKRR